MTLPDPPACSLCLSPSPKPLYLEAHLIYYQCEVCDLIFLRPTDRLTPEAERAQYLLHENDVTDPRYQRFVSPLVDAIKSQHPPGSHGLDYGCGPGPVLSYLLVRDGYHVTLYDPIFKPDADALGCHYDFVAVSEVVEHFHHPRREFERLRQRLRAHGTLAVMTLRHDANTNFGTWHYRRDPTHVAFYSLKTFQWIHRECGFATMRPIGPRVVLLKTGDRGQSRD